MIGPRPSDRAIVVATMICAVGCRQSPSPAPTSADPGPIDTIAQLIRMRNEASYRAMESVIVPGQAEAVVRTIVAIDGFLAANRALADYARAEFSSGLAASLDQSHLASHLDVFSTDVELVDETIAGDRAEVSYLVGGRIPLKRTHLVRIDGRWRYDPGDGYDSALPAAFDRMAEGLRQLLVDLRSGRLPREPYEQRPEMLVEEVRLRLAPGIRLLRRPTQTGEHGDARP